MKHLTIFNLITNIGIICYFLYKFCPLYITANRTFWCKKTYSFTIMLYTRRSSTGSSARGLFTIPIRSYRKMETWDTAMFKSGAYKAYNK